MRRVRLGEAEWIYKVDRVVSYVVIKVGISACEASRILQCPSADLWIVIPGSKPDKTGLRVIKASSEAEGLESGIRVENPAAELVEVHPL